MAKKPVKKAPAKPGKKPTRGVAKRAPVRVKASKPKPRTVALNAPQVLHVPDGDLSKAEPPRTVREGWEQVKALGAARELMYDKMQQSLAPEPRRGFWAWLRGLFGA